MKIFDIDSSSNWYDNLESCDLIANIGEVEVDISSVLHINDAYYSVGYINLQNNDVGAHKIEYKPDGIDEYDQNFKCPCCGYVDNDAWELSEGDDDIDCGRCGAKLHYCKEPVVYYNVELLNAPPVIEINSEKNLSEQAAAKRREYKKAWNAKNRDKVKEHTRRYWERKVLEGSKVDDTGSI